jgi:hypothetical protein
MFKESFPVVFLLLQMTKGTPVQQEDAQGFLLPFFKLP